MQPLGHLLLSGAFASCRAICAPGALGHVTRSQWQSTAATVQHTSQRSLASLPSHTVLGMPALSPTMSQGNVASWKVKEGDEVQPGSVLAEIETDKASMEFENQDSGYVAKLLVPEGARDLPIGSPLLVLVDDKAFIPAFATYTADGAPAAANSTAPAATAGDSSKPPTAAPGPKASPRVVANHRMGPAARKLLSEAGLTPADITNITGPAGIITKGDVLAAISAGAGSKTAQPQAATPSPPTASTATPQQASPTPPAPHAAQHTSKSAANDSTTAASASAAPKSVTSKYTDTPNAQIRKIIAQRLVESKVTIPGLYASVDVQLDGLVELRHSLASQGVKLSVNDFVLKAIAMALKEVPAANALWDSKQQQATVVPSIDISVAVATDKGLITPIVKAADSKAIAQISTEVKALAAKARANKLKPEEFQGGSFTVSNLGMYNISEFSAIINPPQGAILAVGGSQQKVVLQAGKPKAVSYMTVTVSADHRMYDGELVSQLLGSFQRHMQAPVNLLL